MWSIGVLAAAIAMVGCRGAPTECVQGDRMTCQCDDGRFGYQHCSLEGQFAGACECNAGILPDAGPSPYDRCGIAASYRIDCATPVDAVQPGDVNTADQTERE